MSTPPPPDIKAPPPPSPASVRRAEAAEEDRPHQMESLPATPTHRVSMYVTLFNEMITTVLEQEEYLFTPREAWVLRYILALPYEPHYLLTRLLLRRPGKVHALSSIAPAYSGELGEDGVVRAARALCGDLDVPEEVMDDGPGVVSDFWTEMEPAQERPWAGIDTGLSAEEESADPELAEAIRQSLWAEGRGASEPQAQEKPLHLQHDPITALAQDETDLTLSDIITSVPADDLRRVARARKVPQTLLATRESTAKALLDVAHTQTTLSFAPRNGRPRAGGTSEHLVIAHLLPCLGGHVIRIDKSLYALIARVNLVFSRTPPTSASAPALLLPPILVASQRRHYPDYGPPTRSVIWKDRGEILTWERVVTWEAMVSEALGDNWADRRKGTAGPGSFNRGPFLSRQEGAKIVRDVWAKVWPYWKDMVAGQGGEPVLACENMGDRFKTGHALTRIVYKGVDALGSLHEFDLQCEVLRALLGQRRWRRGKRGAWYERLALTLMTHFKGTEDQRREKLEEATQVCIDGLLDEDTHLIYRPGLSHRLTRLENRLNLPPEERHISYAQLLTCETRELVAPRIQQNAGLVRAPSARRISAISATGPAGYTEEAPAAPASPQVGKSVWQGQDTQVSVEGWVLEWWEAKGYKGFHAESSILTTLFCLLMWPVLFHPIPGAFETLYQTAPLDLGEDTFARARSHLIEARLAAMESTETALEMLKEVDARERERGTWAVGLSWEFGAQDLEEILECIGGRAMATLCRMLCEEYRHRASGVPDLIVWNYEQKEARFVEVKGPGDSLSETQKIWIDVLLSSGVPVEVCRVVEEEKGGSKPKATPKLVKRKSSGREKDKSPELIVVDTSEEEENEEWAYESGEEGKRQGHWHDKRARR